MYDNKNILSSRKLNCGCPEDDPNCTCPETPALDGGMKDNSGVNVNVIFDSGNTSAPYRNDNRPFTIEPTPVFQPMYTETPVINPQVIQPMVQPMIQPQINQPAVYQVPMQYVQEPTVPPTQYIEPTDNGIISKILKQNRDYRLTATPEVTVKPRCVEYFYPAWI